MAAAPSDRAPSDRAVELSRLGEGVRAHLDGENAARERGLAACRRATRAAGSSIRAVHRHDREAADRLRGESEAAIREAQGALAEHPRVAHAGFLHDAEKEYAEACLTAALVDDLQLPGPADVGVTPQAWLNGLAEAASELRRQALDRLRGGELAEAERLVAVMDAVYDVLFTFDYPDAVSGGLRRSVDALRGVLERTRGDLTTTAIQSRLEQALARSQELGG